MTILRVQTRWQRKPDAAKAASHRRLTLEEQENVRRALAFLRIRFGSWPKLANAMGISIATVERFGKRSRAISIGSTLRAARVAEVPVEAIITGHWPEPDRCPHCGRR